MTAQPPPIDPRDRQQLLEQITELAQRYSDWRPRADGQPDAGAALISIAARFAELVVQRINRVPERNYLAFLNLIGTQLRPPLPARVPLTFTLAEGSQVGAVVPAGTQAAAAPQVGEEDEIVFETDTALVVSRAQLRAVFVGDAENDTYSDRTAQATGQDPMPFPVFTGDQPAPHQLFIACNPGWTSPDKQDVTVVMPTRDNAQLASWPISWTYWDGTAWQPVSSRSEAARDAQREDIWRVTLLGLPPLPSREVNGISSGWVRAQLDLPLPRGESGLAPESVAVGGRAPQDEVAGLFPFGETSQVKWCYLSADDAIAVGGATVHFDVVLARPGVERNRATPVQLVWSYKVGSEWKELGRSSSQSQQIAASDVGFQDESLALTRNGEFRFRVPQPWPRELFRGRFGRWLRVEIADEGGGYATLPQLTSLTARYGWDLPTLSWAGATASTWPKPVPSPAAFANSSPLDLSKDFYPFGEQPRFNDTCYLACPDELARRGGVVALGVTLTNAADGGPVPKVRTDGRPEISWEAWDGTGWQKLTPASPNASYAFTSNATLNITLPAGFAPAMVGGEQRYWLRARLVRGNYGDPATVAPPVVQALSWTPSPSGQNLVPSKACVSFNDFRYTTHPWPAAPGQERFTPFAPGTDHDPALYLGFDQPFEPEPVTLYLHVEPPTPEQVAAAALAELDPATRAQVIWEYSGPGGWQPLAALDQTDGLASRDLVQFTGPADLVARDCFGQRGYWVRARWHHGQFPVPPALRRVLLNTTWATQASTISEEILGSGNGEPAQRVTTAQTPVLPGQRLVVREPDLAEGGQDVEIWVHWQPVPDFYSSGPLDRRYTIDPLNGEIRFGDGRAGRLPPRGQNNIRISYRTGGGAAGNRAETTIATLRSAVPSIEAVTNHERSQGGSPQESFERLYARGPRLLRHGDRAVTAEDLEDIAFEASTEVARVRAVLPSLFDPFDLWLDPAAPQPRTGHGEADAGRAGVIVVPDSAQPRPTPSLGLLRQVQAQLQARCPATAQLWVAGPEWIRVTVTATVVPLSPEVAEPVRGLVKAALQRYLHPLTGGPDGRGWAFGRKPHRSDLFAVVEAVQGVDHVRSLEVAMRAESEQLGARLDAVLSHSLAEAAAAPPAADLRRWLSRALAYSGPHEITVTLRG